MGYYHPLPVLAHRRRTVRDPVPKINLIAAGSLVVMGLARANYSPVGPDVFVHDGMYSLTDKGEDLVLELKLVRDGRRRLQAVA